jgi:hypothetical protein
MSYALEAIYLLNLLVKVLNGFKSQPNISSFFYKIFFISCAHVCNANYTTYWQVLIYLFIYLFWVLRSSIHTVRKIAPNLDLA